MRNRVWGSLLLACGLLGACGKAASIPSLGGETHWLQQCGGPEDEVGADGCGPGLTCSCGICTTACSDDASCSGGVSAAVCAEPASSPFTTACGSEAAQRLCVPLIGSTYTAEIQGLRYEERGCFRALATAGVRTTPSPSGPPCAEVVTEARDPAGNCWRFFDNCLPDGFTEITTSEACTSASDICPQSLDCADDQVATVEGCLSCSDAVDAILAQQNAVWERYRGGCSSDDDCVLGAWERTGCSEYCGVGLNRSNVEAFRADAIRIGQGYCTDPSRWVAKCGQGTPSCVGAFVCREGICTARR